MHDAAETPLHLFQVLEEEYVSLYGPIPDEALVVELPDEEIGGECRNVTAKLDWLFHQGHIKDPVGFANDLRRYEDLKAESVSWIPSGMQPFNWAKENLKDYLSDSRSPRINPEKVRALRGGAETKMPALRAQDKDFAEDEREQEPTPGREQVEALETELNKVLDADDLYKSDRFANYWLSSATRALIDLHAIKPFQGDDLKHFNRLLLEDAFRESLEKIHNIRLAAIYQRLHEKKQAALCLSGGGIRSGTFALGVLQGLARHKLLKEFHYLSTVSGGGYIGSWLTAWIHRHPDGLEGVTRDLANSPAARKIDPDPDPIRYLRKYSSFLTPKVGLFSADTWTFIGIYLRNLVLNWLVFVPLLIGVLTIPRLIIALTLIQPENLIDRPNGFLQRFSNLSFLYGRYFFLAFGSAVGIWALSYIIFSRPGAREQLRTRAHFWRERGDQSSFLRLCLLPLTISAVCLTTYWAWSREHHEHLSTLLVLIEFVIFGVVLALLAWLVASLVLRRLAATLELIGLCLAGAFAGLFFWLISLQSIGNPVIGYGNSYDTGVPFPWTSWSTDLKWTWSAWTTELWVCLAVPLFMLVFLGGATIFVGVSSKFPSVDDEDREWWSRSGAWMLIVIIWWVIGNVVVILGPIALLDWPRVVASIGGLSGLIAVLIGRSSKSPANARPPDEKDKKSLVAAFVGRALPLLAAVFIAAFVAAASLATTGIIQGLALMLNKVSTGRVNEWLTNVPEPGFSKYIEYIFSGVKAPDTFTAAKIIHMNVLHHTSIWFVGGLAAIMFAFGGLMAWAINLNLFSLHAGYRSRLIRAFLGASRPDHERNPNPFTGFDPEDNLHMHELRPGLLAETDLVDPRFIARSLSDEQDNFSRFVSEFGLLERTKKGLKKFDSLMSPSPALIATMREDLNRLLEDENIRLYEEPSLQVCLQSPEASPVRTAIAALSGEQHIRLNRLVLERCYPLAIKPSRRLLDPFRLQHVINTTLNLVAGSNLAWQQRKAEPFSVAPLHSGCFRLGYRRSRDYGGRDQGGISVGTAAAISGAAVSSNMGYYTTSPIISLILTLFNVRLGWWLGNPGPAGNDTYTLRAPSFSIAPVISEAFGLTDDQNKYVYLTDGGHFENLAVYEMVLRRCHVIVACDGAQDADYHFTDLGNAVRKIRIDFGVPIEFISVPIYAQLPPKEEGRGMYWAIGKIRYTLIDKGPGVRDGVLIYIKPAVYGNEPRDVFAYKKAYPAFPHQTTADQFFDEPQFESYRALGSHIMDQLCGDGTDELNLGDVVERAVAAMSSTADG